MGFYGNVVNNNNRQFTFDRIYPNRQAMRDRAAADDIFVGRFVLIDYNEGDVFRKYYKQLYRQKSDDGTERFYFQDEKNTFTEAIVIDANYYKELESGTTIINPDYNTEGNKYKLLTNEPFYVYEDNKYYFYKCLGEGNFLLVYSSQENDDVYSINFKIDSLMSEFDDRGWDSTVWQKIVYKDEEKYAMIAELNATIPTFDVVVTNAPTMNPMKPYFDINSTNIHYNLNLQPSWGFRVKEAAETAPSDTTIDITEYYWDDISNSASKKPNLYKGAIYFNRDGFDVNKHYVKNYDNEKDDYISVLPTGASGYPYSSISKNDIQELTINLPGIGHAVSTMWDLIYGTGESQETEENQEAVTIKNRNTEIGWNNISGLRLIKTKSDGFDYNVDAVTTLAGCINSVHDLMGMIITSDKDQKNLNIENALTNRIYYKDKKYQIKVLTDKLISIDDDEYNGQINNILNFGDNFYYLNNNNYYWEEKHQHGNIYYKLTSDDNIQSVKLYSEPWEYGKYYYKDSQNNYILAIESESDEKHHPNKNITYYLLADVSAATIKVNHKLGENGICFYPVDNNGVNQEYIKKLFPTIDDENAKCALFKKIIDDGKPGYMPVDFENDLYVENGRYFYWENYKIEDSTTTGGDIVETYDFNDAVCTVVNMVEFKENTYYYQDETGNWKVLTNIDNSNTYYTFDSEDAMKPTVIEEFFYQPNVYYYKDNKDFILATENNRIKKTDEYYVIKQPNEPVNKPGDIFYEPNKYYYKNSDGVYILDTANKKTDDRQYYFNMIEKYVIEDDQNIFTPGEKWNDDVTPPLGVKLGYKKDTYEWKELKGFGRTLNTIHGLILHINNILKIDDKITRDTNTVQGCINKMNDIINKIETLKPNYLIAVNKYGKITSMQPKGDNWISVSVSGNNNEIIINHKTNEGQTTSTTVGNDTKNLNFGESFNIPQLIVDKAGHVTEATNQSITLPSNSYTPSTTTSFSTDVITSIGFNSTTGAITSTKADSSTLKLNSSYTTASVAANIDEKDTINSAFGKLEYKLNVLNGAPTEIGSVDYKIAQFITEDKVEQWKNVQSNWNETNSNSDAFILNKPDLTDLIKTTSEFNYNYNETITPMTIQELIDYIAKLETRIYNLEHPTESEPEAP